MENSWVITDAGLITAAGDTVEALFAAVRTGAPLVRSLPSVDVPVADIPDFDAKRYLLRKGVKDLSRISQLACAAASRCTGGFAGLEGSEVGVVFGSAWASLSAVVEFEREACVEGPRFVDPIRFTETVANVPGGQVAIWFGWSAFNATVSAGSTSGLSALLRALDFLEEGRGRAALAGGGDALNPALLRSLRAEGLLAAGGPPAPFGAGRSGPVGGEGASFLAVESLRSATERGRAPAATIRGWETRFAGGAARSDAGLDRSVIAETMRGALERSALAPAQIDMLVVAASGDRAHDAAEAEAILTVFGEGPEAPPVVVPKGILGETWGASGPIAASLACESMRTGIVPARPRGLALDPSFAGLHVPSETLTRDVRHAMVLDGSSTGHVIGMVLAKGDR